MAVSDLGVGMNDDVAISRWFVCGMMFLLAVWQLTSGLEYLIKHNWSIMTIMSFAGMICWTLFGMNYWNKPKIESTEDNE